MFAQDSIELLKQSGIDFAKMEARGIDVSNFGELLMSSGIVLNEDVSRCQTMSLQFAATVSKLPSLQQVKWITFHSGYDFGYLLKVLTCQPLPKTEADFFELLKVNLLSCLSAHSLPSPLCLHHMCYKFDVDMCEMTTSAASIFTVI